MWERLSTGDKCPGVWAAGYRHTCPASLGCTCQQPSWPGLSGHCTPPPKHLHRPFPPALYISKHLCRIMIRMGNQCYPVSALRRCWSLSHLSNLTVESVLFFLLSALLTSQQEPPLGTLPSPFWTQRCRGVWRIWPPNWCSQRC